MIPWPGANEPKVATHGPNRSWLIPTLAGSCLLITLWSFLGTEDRATWAFEVLPMTAVLGGFALTMGRFRFSGLVYVLLTWFYFIQCLGGRYTFAEVPFPAALMELLGLERNPVDRFGHFFQGFVPAMVLRELLIRRVGLHRGPVLFWLVTASCLGFSASYELLEMAVVLVFYPGAGPEWLGMQGDPWDTQWDMTMAVSGALLAQLTLSRLQDRGIASVTRSEPHRGR
jgi:putative membrane protein